MQAMGYPSFVKLSVNLSGTVFPGDLESTVPGS